MDLIPDPCYLIALLFFSVYSMSMPQLIYSSGNWHLVCFWFLAIINNACINIPMYVSLCTFATISLEHMPSSGTAK